MQRHSKNNDDSWIRDAGTVLAHVPAGECEGMAQALTAMGYVEERNTTGMIMLALKDCFDAPFLAGEALATEAVVRRQDRLGYGIVIGDIPAAAYVAACADAAAQANDTPALAAIRAWLDRQRVWRDRYLAEERAQVAGTKVNFGLMVEG